MIAKNRVGITWVPDSRMIVLDDGNVWYCTGKSEAVLARILEDRVPVFMDTLEEVIGPEDLADDVWSMPRFLSVSYCRKDDEGVVSASEDCLLEALDRRLRGFGDHKTADRIKARMFAFLN